MGLIPIDLDNDRFNSDRGFDPIGLISIGFNPVGYVYVKNL
jgi:hypothetical protein